MASFSYTLKSLQQRVNTLIDQQGPDAPAAYWIYTNEDIFTIDDNGDEEYQPIDVCEEVLSDIQDVDYIHTVIVDAIEDSLKDKAKWDLSSPLSLSSLVLTLASTLLTPFQNYKMQNYNDSAKLIQPSQQIVQRYYNNKSDADWDDILSPDDYEEYLERRQYEKMMRR